jgi:hypothetical protein
MPDRYEEQIRKKLQDFRPEYNPADWEAMSAQLDQHDQKKAGFWSNQSWSRYAVVALLLLLVGASTWIAIDPTSESGQIAEETQLDQNPTVVNEEASPESDILESNSDKQNASTDLDRIADENDQAGTSLAEASMLPSNENPSEKIDNTSSEQARPAQDRVPGEAKPDRIENNSNTAVKALDQQDRIAASDLKSNTLSGRQQAAQHRQEATSADHLEGNLADVVESQEDQLRSGTLSGAELADEGVDQALLDFIQATEVSRAPVASLKATEREASSSEAKDRKRQRFNVGLFAGPGLNATYTASDDAFSPSWDLNAGLEFSKKHYAISVGLRYGQYRFQQQSVSCGNPGDYGLTSTVHCADQLNGDFQAFEIPLQLAYLHELPKMNGRLRLFGGVNLRRYRSQAYEIEFRNVMPGDTLFFPPNVIQVAPTTVTADVLTVDDQVESSLASNPAQENTFDPWAWAAEFGFGYDQRLGNNLFLGLEPRVTVPFDQLEIHNRRGVTAGITAKLRWNFVVPN